jgi:hypothetical protein
MEKRRTISEVQRNQRSQRRGLHSVACRFVFEERCRVSRLWDRWSQFGGAADSFGVGVRTKDAKGLQSGFRA